ncbi:MAG: hypothetical protein NVV72_11255 [Asticcacaulis sp.]|nr:hypothetical protein [Asticcacaulis sp.]
MARAGGILSAYKAPCPPIGSAFGGIVATNRQIDANAAARSSRSSPR